MCTDNRISVHISEISGKYIYTYMRSLKPERIVSGLKPNTLAISPAMQNPQARHCSVP